MEQKTKLGSADTRTKFGTAVHGSKNFEDFLQNLLAVDFNSRHEEAKYK